MTQIRVPSERRIRPAEMTRVPAVAVRNINAVVYAQFNSFVKDIRGRVPGPEVCRACDIAIF